MRFAVLFFIFFSFQEHTSTNAHVRNDKRQTNKRIREVEKKKRNNNKKALNTYLTIECLSLQSFAYFNHYTQFIDAIY